MSVIEFQKFKSAVPIASLPQAQMDLALQLVLSLALPAPIRGGRNATVDDVNEAIEAIGRVHALYVDFISSVMRELNSNLPVTENVDTKEFLAGLADIKSDMIGLLAIRAQQIMEDA